MHRNEFHKKTRAEIEEMNSEQIQIEIQRLLTFLNDLKQTLPADDIVSDDLKTRLAASLSKQITRWIAEGAKDQPKTHSDIQKIKALDEDVKKAKSLGDLNFLVDTVLNKHYEAVYRARPSSTPIEDLSSRLEDVKRQLLSIISSPKATDEQVDAAEELNDLVNQWRSKLQEMKKNLKEIPYTEAAKTKEIRAAIRSITKEISAKLKEPEQRQQMPEKLVADLQGAANIIIPKPKKKVARNKKPASDKKAESSTPKQHFGGFGQFAAKAAPTPPAEQTTAATNRRYPKKPGE